MDKHHDPITQQQKKKRLNNCYYSQQPHLGSNLTVFNR